MPLPPPRKCLPFHLLWNRAGIFTYTLLATCSCRRQKVSRELILSSQKTPQDSSVSLLAILVKHSSQRTGLLLLLLLLKLMESGRKIFCFSNPGFCQANTGILLKMALEELISAQYRSSHPPTSNHIQSTLTTMNPLPVGDEGDFFFFSANKT